MRGSTAPVLALRAKSCHATKSFALPIFAPNAVDSEKREGRAMVALWWGNLQEKKFSLRHRGHAEVDCTRQDLELPSTGWQLFVLGSPQSDSTAFLSFLDTYATRQLTKPLKRRIDLRLSARQTKRR